jgi:hypothetical protein
MVVPPLKIDNSLGAESASTTGATAPRNGRMPENGPFPEEFPGMALLPHQLDLMPSLQYLGDVPAISWFNLIERKIDLRRSTSSGNSTSVHMKVLPVR